MESLATEQNIINVIQYVVIGFFFLITVKTSLKIVPQSRVFVIERFGKYQRTLNAGLSLIVPFLDKVAHKVDILERETEKLKISVITKDNVEIDLETIVFYRIIEASKSVYRISNVNSALRTAATSIVRSAGGKLELDEIQSSRAQMNNEIKDNLILAAEVWGIEVTRTEVVDVIVDSVTKDAQRQQLAAERRRRALIAEAEGEKRAVELNAEAELYRSKQEAEAIKLKADADAYSVKTKAEADALQTKLLAEAIENNGQAAVDFEIRKQQVQALAKIASSESTKSLILPTELTGAISSVGAILESAKHLNGNK